MDDSRYEVRREAARRIEQRMDEPSSAAALAAQFDQLLLQPELSMELRWRISLWRKRLPPARAEPPDSIAPAELDRLVHQLDDDSFAVREGAAERLQWMVGSERLAKPIVLGLQRRLCDPLISEECYCRIESICSVAWCALMTDGGGDWTVTSPSDAQIATWLDELTEPPRSSPGSGVRRRVARRQLLDALSQDKDAARVKAAVQARLKIKPNTAAASQLTELLDLTRPVIILECWSGGMQVQEQRLVVGVPTQPPEGEHAIFFDHADEQSANCITSNSLAPGKYPVSIAFVPPNCDPSHPVAFNLVFLPTPRRQIAYSYFVKTNPAARLARLSRRTLDQYASHRRLLDGYELEALSQLDSHEVSRFAGRFFISMKDGPVEVDLDEGANLSQSRFGSRVSSQNSCLGAICVQLAVNGTQEAVPGLLAALRQRKFRPPVPAEPYRLPWLAALSIAQRDPWPEVDPWLAENLDNAQTLALENDQWGHRLRRAVEVEGHQRTAVAGAEPSATIGATAAAILLTRHGQRPEAFGLQRTIDKQLEILKLPGYRFSKPDDIERVHRWWSYEGTMATK